jgi:hypothetical protein
MILVQREFTVPRADRADFERQSREGLWPTFLHFGAQMVAFGSWAFGDNSDPLVTHTVYEDMEHWEATRGASTLSAVRRTTSYYDDPAIMEETRELRSQFENRNALVSNSKAHPFEIFTQTPHPSPFRRQAGQRLAETPHNFGRGSIVSERTIALRETDRDEFIRLSAEVVWPWLEAQGGHGIAIGHDLMGASNEITTWFAFPTMALWYRCARPAAAHAPAELVDAYQRRHALVRHQRGRILVIGTDWGAAPPTEG